MNAKSGLHKQSVPTRAFRSELLGSLSIDPAEIFHFPTGLLGFPDSHDYVLLPAEREGLHWLQSTEHSALTFLLVDPFPFFPGYSVDIEPNDLHKLGHPEKSELLILAVVTLPRRRNEPLTANLQGPIALNLGARIARQIPIGESEHGIREPFALPTAD